MKNILIAGLIATTAFCCSAQEALIFSGRGSKPVSKPRGSANWIATELEELGYTVTIVTTMDCMDDADALKKYDLIVPCWTGGLITEKQMENFSDAVKAGAGVAGLHGDMAFACCDNPKYEEMIGGIFLKHPYKGPYTVDICLPDHPVTQGLPASFEYDSEKFLLRTSPEITVLATTDYTSIDPDLKMPVSWVKTWGKGRIFYTTLGHKPSADYQQFPDAKRLFINGIRWAGRKPIQ